MRQKIVIFLMLSVSAVLSHRALSDSKPEDQINFASLDSREKNLLLTSPQDLPNEIVAVHVKDEGNANDPDTNLGMVIQQYSISRTEVTARQYCTYLNQVATGDNFERFYNEKMGTDPNVASIKRDVVDGKNVYTVIVDTQGDHGNYPIVYVSLYQAARFCNWLQNQNTPGLTGDDLTERGAYTLDGTTSGRIARNPDAVWFIPTESEWYKTAYYKGGGLRAGYWNFANRSDWAPSNGFEGGINSANYKISSYTKKGPPYLTDVGHFQKSVGPYNTLDMSGNVAEWVATEEDQGAMPLKYVARGGSWKSLYYGKGLESKSDMANWGLELSKWSRPAYDPTQGYDDIGFRVATSLIVNSSSLATAAPGESELSPKEALEAPFMLLAGIGGILSAKKKGWCHQSDGRTSSNQEQLKALRERTASVNEENKTGTGRRTEVSSPESSKDSASQAMLPKKPVITRQQKTEIEDSLAQISVLFEEAVKQHKEAKKNLNQKGETKLGDLQKLKQVSNDYDRYADAVLKTLAKLQENFPYQKELWLPWYETAKKVLIEAMILGHAMTKQHCQKSVFDNLKPDLQEKVARMRNESNEKTLRYLEFIQRHQQALEKSQGEKQEIGSEQSLLDNIKNRIKEYEPEFQKSLEVGAGYVSQAYEEYATIKSQIVGTEGKNIEALFCLDPNKKTTLTNLVLVAGLGTRLETFLKECEVHDESPIYSTISHLDIYSKIGGDEVKGDDNPVNGNNGKRKQRGENELIMGKIVPRTLDNQFQEQELLNGYTFVN